MLEHIPPYHFCDSNKLTKTTIKKETKATEKVASDKYLKTIHIYLSIFEEKKRYTKCLRHESENRKKIKRAQDHKVQQKTYQSLSNQERRVRTPLANLNAIITYLS